MMKNRIDICITLYFQEFAVGDWAMGTAILADDISKTLGTGLTHFSLNYFGEKGLLIKEKVYRFVDRNTSKLRLDLESHKLRNLYFYRSESADVLHNSELIVAIDVDSARLPYGRCYVEFPLQWISSANVSEVAYLLLKKANTLVDIDYGLVTTMLSSKLPAIYFADGYISNLDQVEILDLAIWLRHKADYSKKVRGLYLGNLLGSGHLEAVDNANYFIGQVREILGNEHVRTLTSAKLFFDLVEDEERLGQLRALLKNYGLLMHADGTEQIPSLYYMKR